jgi:hypothetical protein
MFISAPIYTPSLEQHNVQRTVLLHVVVGKGVVIRKLFAGKDETLLVRGDAFLVLDLWSP